MNKLALCITKLALCITKLAFSLAVVVAILLPVLGTAPAHAAGNYTRTWISGIGNDSNSGTGCQQAAPCVTFAAALGQTVTGGEVNCTGPAGVNGIASVTFTITFSVTIDCHDSFGAFTTGADYPSAITINAPGSDVILRNLSMDGFVQYNNGANAASVGILIQAASRVEIDSCKIFNFGQRGIDDVRTTGSTQLFVHDSTIRGNTGTGIALAAAAKNSVVLENVHSVGNAYGVAAASGNIVVVRNSVMSENSIAGIFADTGSTVSVDNTMVSHNTTAGIQANGTVVIDNSDIKFNTSSITGATTSYGNNRIFGNGAGTTPTIIAQQ